MSVDLWTQMMRRCIARLGQSAIKMYVAAIDEYMLPCCVARFFRNQKQYCRRDLIRRGHSFAHGNLGKDGPQLLFWIVEGIEPLAIERSHYFRRNHSVNPNAVIKQLRRPFPREGEYCTL